MADSKEADGGSGGVGVGGMDGGVRSKQVVDSAWNEQKVDPAAAGQAAVVIQPVSGRRAR